LIELLMVIAIIALLAALGVPAIQGLTSSNKSAVATRQLADDLKLARSKAISERTTVYVVFVPTNFTGLALQAPVDGTSNPPRPTDADLELLARNDRLIEKLLNQKYTSYAFFAERRAGDQPGRPSARYITAWKSLPEGSFVAPREFTPMNNGTEWSALAIDMRPLPYDFFPFPGDTDDCPDFPLPYIAFNHLGQLVQPRYLNVPLGTQLDEAIHLAQGSIFYPRDADGELINESIPGVPFEEADLLETPPGNSENFWVRVNWLTGRPQIDQPQIID
jgi:type II secretory pathway pseudopilin PulG